MTGGRGKEGRSIEVGDEKHCLSVFCSSSMVIGLQQLITKISVLLEFLPINEDPFALYTSRNFLNPAESSQTLHRIASFPNYDVHL